MTDAEADAIALWIVASYLIDSFRIFPRLTLISPEKRCGKTTTLEVISALTKNSLPTSNLTAAAIFRITKQFMPTLLIDEADTFVKGGNQEIIGIINSGHTKATAHTMRCDGDAYKSTVFSTWMPMVLASIGDLAGTIMDRSIVVRLRRKKANESVLRLPNDLMDLQIGTRDRIQAWCDANDFAVRNATAGVPSIGNDRAEDNWFPLFSIAEVIGGVWPSRCETAYRALTQESEPELQTQLLGAIRELFKSSGKQRLGSEDIRNTLLQDTTGPWQECNNGRTISQNQIARLLGVYGIRPKLARIDEKVKRGYELDDFEDAFERYLH